MTEKREKVLAVAKAILLQGQIAVPGDWGEVVEDLCDVPESLLPSEGVADWVRHFFGEHLSEQSKDNA